MKSPPKHQYAFMYHFLSLDFNHLFVYLSLFHILFCSFPPDNINPDVYLNRGLCAQFLALKSETSLLCAVDQLAYILEHDRVKTLIKIEFFHHLIISALKTSSIKERVIKLSYSIKAITIN